MLDGWSTENAGAVRRLTLGIRLRTGAEATLLAALRTEPGITAMQLDPAP
jgi:hypothetical protein